MAIQNSQAPPLRWQLARVVGVHPGADSVVRVATVHTSTGLMKRPVGVRTEFVETDIYARVAFPHICARDAFGNRVVNPHR
ncbi:hypothetical protein NQ318_008070 [Aromia moschata]|uniref:DUF5641 domain-containing protein n=1 Tax=Aromia moschata TaxID=1265417 RepID=A0AAV8YPZ0_9CUCU|nr:hypothetical protein NQ318_008070 [Aromia moschata]